MDPSRLPRLVVTTEEIDPVDDLLLLTEPDAPLAWMRRDHGIVGASAPVVELQLQGSGASPARFADLWRRLAATAIIRDDVRLPGTGLVGFGALAFDPQHSSAGSALIVPSYVFGRHDGRSWVTRISRADATTTTPVPAANGGLTTPTPYGPLWSATLGPGRQGPAGYQASVAQGIAAIAAGDYDKVVLARDVAGTIPRGADLRRLVRALAHDYPDTWTFAVDGLVGASPETLITVREGRATARVLAGTTPRGADATEDAAASAALMQSEKDLSEHRFAVQSVLDTLAPHTRDLHADDSPFALELPNLWHLATDVAGTIRDDASALDLVAVLHPTAAVAGTPTDAAIRAIRDLEPFDRGRYAGPVGWVDGNGDGEWAIALRCAQIGSEGGETRPVTAYAGAGIVAGSVPETELLETRVKLRPVIDALA
ncbi:isochorismate synthase MenF [Microbacterium sp. C7(2022)]|uniref:isochorismate synthase n=1 Tax=Microbacterium sp. C7(2022) TaxID=2992759 RepID=UPI00237A90CB|nr:isochorismate synthase [Microbacterium sp. C7(2022)]MDE0546150.1 chorismate-binding protein [Microbacterium sp. C7(2022)]